MLTLRQTLIVSGPGTGGALTTSFLRAQHLVRPLSLASVARGLEQQRLVVFVTLASTRIFSRRTITSMAELDQAARTVDALLRPAEIEDLAEMFKQRDISLRLVDHAQQLFALLALVPSLVNAPATVVDPGNLIHIRDKFSGGEAVGGIAAGAGGVLIGVALAVTAPVWVLPVGAALFGFGVGFGITAGIMDIVHDSTPPPRSDSQDHSSTPNDLGPDGVPTDESIETPNAVAIGVPPADLDVSSLVNDLGDLSIDFSIDMVLSDLPTGFDSTTGGISGGVGLPGEGGDDSGLNPYG